MASWRSIILKNLVDQTLHFLWAGVSTALISFSVMGLAHDYRAAAFLVLGLASCIGIIVREYLQWPSSQRLPGLPNFPFDPVLDWTFFLLGGGLGVYIGIICARALGLLLVPEAPIEPAGVLLVRAF